METGAGELSWIVGEPAMGALDAGDEDAPDGAGDAELDAGGTSVVVLVVMITEGSSWSSSSTVRSALLQAMSTLLLHRR